MGLFALLQVLALRNALAALSDLWCSVQPVVVMQLVFAAMVEQPLVWPAWLAILILQAMVELPV